MQQEKYHSIYEKCNSELNLLILKYPTFLSLSKKNLIYNGRILTKIFASINYIVLV